MTTARNPRTKPERASAGSELSLVDGCPGDRVEAFTTTDPTGAAVQVTRCLDCAAASYERE